MMKTINSRILYKEYRKALSATYSDLEAESLTLLLFDKYLSLKKRDLLLDVKLVSLPPALPLALKDLIMGKPIQYLFGEAPFYGRSFIVSPKVLIPRNETEELVHLVLQHQQGKPKILDIGTGSGCIAITLALELPGSEIYAIDVSADALSVARENASQLSADVRYLLGDVLKEDLGISDLDAIVSNPPYVRNSEMQGMHINVLDHEPMLALYVPDDDPLVFYRAIAAQGGLLLKTGGKIYFEINEALGRETQELLEAAGYLNIQIVRDLNRKERMVWAENR